MKKPAEKNPGRSLDSVHERLTTYGCIPGVKRVNAILESLWNVEELNDAASIRQYFIVD
jgi:hypothetical protein